MDYKPIYTLAALQEYLHYDQIQPRWLAAGGLCDPDQRAPCRDQQRIYDGERGPQARKHERHPRRAGRQ